MELFAALICGVTASSFQVGNYGFIPQDRPLTYTLDEAARQCKINFGPEFALAVFTSQAEVDNVVQMMNNNGINNHAYWIGNTEIPWMADGLSNNAACKSIANGEFNNVACDTRHSGAAESLTGMGVICKSSGIDYVNTEKKNKMFYCDLKQIGLVESVNGKLKEVKYLLKDCNKKRAQAPKGMLKKSAGRLELDCIDCKKDSVVWSKVECQISCKADKTGNKLSAGFGCEPVYDENNVVIGSRYIFPDGFKRFQEICGGGCGEHDLHQFMGPEMTPIETKKCSLRDIHHPGGFTSKQYCQFSCPSHQNNDVQLTTANSLFCKCDTVTVDSVSKRQCSWRLKKGGYPALDAQKKGEYIEPLLFGTENEEQCKDAHYLTTTATPITHSIVLGLCESDLCLNLAWQNSWDPAIYEECATQFHQLNNGERKKRSSEDEHSAFAVSDECPFIQCAQIHGLHDENSKSAFDECVEYNAKQMPPVNVLKPNEVVDSCDNYSEAWGECECWNENFHVGCNYNIPGFQRFPDRPEEQGTLMLLVTNNTEPLEDLVTLSEPGNLTSMLEMSKFSSFNPGEKTFFIVHGYTMDRNWTSVDLTRSLKLKNPKWNVIIAEWVDGAAPTSWGSTPGANINTEDYSRACSNTRVMGRQTANFISQLVTLRLIRPGDVHLIGHSLGGHAVGYIGKWFNRMYSERLGRITSLDPAGLKFRYENHVPNFIDHPHCLNPFVSCKWDLTEEEKRRNRIDRTDAAFVDVIHTATAFITGMADPLGHADFYPNGGDLPIALINQKCYKVGNVSADDDDSTDGDQLKYMDSIELNDFIGACPHRYALEYFIASVHNECYQTLHCDSYEDYLNGQCFSGETHQMGLWAEKGDASDDNQQRFYMKTELDCWKNEQ